VPNQNHLADFFLLGPIPHEALPSSNIIHRMTDTLNAAPEQHGCGDLFQEGAGIRAHPPSGRLFFLGPTWYSFQALIEGRVDSPPYFSQASEYFRLTGTRFQTRAKHSRYCS